MYGDSIVNQNFLIEYVKVTGDKKMKTNYSNTEKIPHVMFNQSPIKVLFMVILSLTFIVSLSSVSHAQVELWEELIAKSFASYQEGDYTEAMGTAREALRVAEKEFGPVHYTVAISLNNIATLYIAQNKYIEAEPLYIQSIKVQERALGRNHPNIAMSHANLAKLYSYQEKYEKAEFHYIQALAIYEESIGPDHPDTANILKEMATLYMHMGNKNKARSYILRAQGNFDITVY
ncbi:tetratricopeptide repeat protein [bacterium]|nr:MAG: tetratricopeptide repeat protein [bacterium]